MPNWERYPVFCDINGRLETSLTTADVGELRHMGALLNFETDLGDLQAYAYCALFQALKHTNDETRKGGYLLLDEGNQNPVIIPVGTIAEDKLAKYPAMVHAKWKWLCDHPEAQKSGENLTETVTVEGKEMKIPAGAVAFERNGKRAIIAFSGMKEGDWDEAVALKTAEIVKLIASNDVLQIAGETRDKCNSIQKGFDEIANY